MEVKTFKDKCREANIRADIVAVALHLGMEVNTGGRVPTAHCPFHGDTGRMNLAFYQEPGKKADLPRVYCFACTKMATALDLVMEVTGQDIFQSLDWLQRFVGVSDGEAVRSAPRTIQNKNTTVRRDKRNAVTLAIRRYWGEDGLDARAYLSQRGISDETASAYQIGYWNADDSGWSRRIIIPYLESMELESPIWTMVGARIRPAVNVASVLATGENQHTDEACHRDEGTQRGSLHDPERRGASTDSTGDDRRRRHKHDPKYLYTSAESREPYLWRIALTRAEAQGYLIICEGEIDGLSLLHSLGNDSPVAALGGVGAIAAVGQEPRLAGLDILYIADLESAPRYGTEHEEADKLKLARLEQVVAQNVWKLKQLNANVHVTFPPSINPGGKTDVNDLLMAYGAEGVLDWLLPELEEVTTGGERRSLI